MRLLARARPGTPRRPPRRRRGSGPGRSAQVTISTPSGGSTAGASIAVRSSARRELRPISRKPRRSTQARLSSSSSATVVSSVTQPRSMHPGGELAVEGGADAGAAVLGQHERLARARPGRRVPADVGEAGTGVLAVRGTRRTTPCPRPVASSRRSRRRCRRDRAAPGRHGQPALELVRRRSP